MQAKWSRYYRHSLAGRAEVRAYYVGTALCVGFAIWSLETQHALKAVRSCMSLDIVQIRKTELSQNLKFQLG